MSAMRTNSKNWLTIVLVILVISGWGSSGFFYMWIGYLQSQVNSLQNQVTSLTRQNYELRSTYRVVTIIFDGSKTEFYDSFYPLMKKYGFRGVISIPTAKIDTADSLTWSELLWLAAHGWEVSPHGKNQVHLDSNATEIEIEDELLGAIIGFSDPTMDWKFIEPAFVQIFQAHSACPASINIARKYFYVLSASERLLLTDAKYEDGSIEDWLDEVKLCGGWAKLYTHGTSDISLAYFEEVLKMVQARGLPVLTYLEVIGGYFPHLKPRVEPRTRQIFTDVHANGTESVIISAIKCSRVIFQVINTMDVDATIKVMGALYQGSTTVTWKQIGSDITVASGDSEIIEPEKWADFYKLIMTQTGRTKGVVNAFASLT